MRVNTLTLETDPVLIYRRLDGRQGRSGRVRKISPPPGLDPRTVQNVASSHTDRAIPVLWQWYCLITPLVILTNKNHSTGIHGLCIESRGILGSTRIWQTPCFKCGQWRALLIFSWFYSVLPQNETTTAPFPRLSQFISDSILWVTMSVNISQTQINYDLH